MNVGQMYSGRPLFGGWTIKDWVQGKPLGHPSHAMFVHFPSALLPVAFAFDVITRVSASNSLVRAAFYDVAAGLIVALLAVVTGLADYLPMVGGSKKRQVGTTHLRLQVTGLALFVGSFLIRAGDLDAAQTPWAALALAGLGTVSTLAGNFFGGQLVYRQGMRVSTEL